MLCKYVKIDLELAKVLNFFRLQNFSKIILDFLEVEKLWNWSRKNKQLLLNNNLK